MQKLCTILVVLMQFVLVSSASAGAGTWHLKNSNISNVYVPPFLYGATGQIPVPGDWDGDGHDSPGTFHNGYWYLSNILASGSSQFTIQYGQAGDIPVPGDWNGGTGTLKRHDVGVFRNGIWHHWRVDLNKSVSFWYGQGGDKPVAGDWNGAGYDRVGIMRGSEWHIAYSNQTGGGGTWGPFNWGNSSDVPLLGDWNGDGLDTPGIYRPSNGEFHLSNSPNGLPTAYYFVHGGVPGDKPVVGDWNGDGIDTVGIVRGL